MYQSKKYLINNDLHCYFYVTIDGLFINNILILMGLVDKNAVVFSKWWEWV